LWLVLPLVAAAVLRWHHLDRLEPFVDEGANILTGLDTRIREVFQPLEQGRPLLVWLFRPATFLPGNLLWAARSLAALAGLATIGGLGFVLARLAGWRAAVWGMWLWALLPVAVWHERLALQDPFVTAALTLAVAFLVAAQRSTGAARLAWPACGLMLGVAFLLKISAIFALPWIGILHLGLRRADARPLFDFGLAYALAGALLPVACLGRRLSRLGSGLGNYHVLPTAGGWLAGYLSRLDTWTGWYLGYDGWPLLLLLAIALVAIPRLAAHRTLAWCLAGGWLANLLISSFFYAMPYARYTLPDHLPLVLGVAVVLATVGGKRLRPLAMSAGAIALVRFGMVDIRVVSDPANAPVPESEIEQYVTGPWSGRGTQAVRNYLTAYADLHRTQCLVLTHRGLRPGCYALMLAEWGDARIGVMPFTIYERKDLEATLPSLRKLAQGRAVAFFILYEGSLYPAPAWAGTPGSRTELAATVDRDGGESFSLYRVTP
jgi:4-amino-4-deoxy-L-arabinose transferase-like glycosyltransferase